MFDYLIHNAPDPGWLRRPGPAGGRGAFRQAHRRSWASDGRRGRSSPGRPGPVSHRRLSGHPPSRRRCPFPPRLGERSWPRADHRGQRQLWAVPCPGWRAPTGRRPSPTWLPSWASCPPGGMSPLWRTTGARPPTPARLHTGMLVGMGTLRACVAGFRDGPLTEAEYRQLHALLERALGRRRPGGSPWGWGYAPECFTTPPASSGRWNPCGFRRSHHRPHAAGGGRREWKPSRRCSPWPGAFRTPVEISHLQGHRPAQLAPGSAADAGDALPGRAGGTGHRLRRLPPIRRAPPSSFMCCRRSSRQAVWRP